MYNCSMDHDSHQAGLFFSRILSVQLILYAFSLISLRQLSVLAPSLSSLAFTPRRRVLLFW